MFVPVPWNPFVSFRLLMKGVFLSPSQGLLAGMEEALYRETLRALGCSNG